jgi:hypothetical protein
MIALGSFLIGLWNGFSTFMETHIAPGLRAMLAPLDAWLNSLPWWTGRACAVGLFAIVGLWALTLKRSYIYLGAPDKRLWRDLRIWTVLALLPYIIIYLLY